MDSIYKNDFIDEMFTSYGDYYKSIGVTKQEVIEQMDEFRSMLNDSNKYVKANGIPIKDVNGDIVGYTLGGEAANWRVENCAEVWAVRNAILGGAKVENIVLRTIEYVDGTVKSLCGQCKITFKTFIDSGRIIGD